MRDANKEPELAQIIFTPDERKQVAHILKELEPETNEMTADLCRQFKGYAEYVRKQMYGAMIMGLVARALAATVSEESLTASEPDAIEGHVLDMGCWGFDLEDHSEGLFGKTRLVFNDEEVTDAANKALRLACQALCDEARDRLFPGSFEERMALMAVALGPEPE